MANIILLAKLGHLIAALKKESVKYAIKTLLP